MIVNNTDGTANAEVEIDDTSDNVKLTWANFVTIWNKGGSLMSNLAVVYYFEYVITTGFTQGTTDNIEIKYPERIGTYAYTNAFVLFNFCYQTGVFMSRSSLAVVKIEKVWILSAIQAVFFTLFLVNSFTIWLSSIEALWVIMIFVGLMGGASYVNVVYRIRNSDRLDRNEKELTMVMSTVFNDIGMLAASITALILTTTVYPKPSN